MPATAVIGAADSSWVALSERTEREGALILDEQRQRRRGEGAVVHRIVRRGLLIDGGSLLFYSNRTGAWQAWTIALGGSGLRQLTDVPGSVVYRCCRQRASRSCRDRVRDDGHQQGEPVRGWISPSWTMSQGLTVHVPVLLMAAVLSLVTPAGAMGQGAGPRLTVQGLYGTHLTEGGDSQSVSVGVSFQRVEFLVSAERLYLPVE